VTSADFRATSIHDELKVVIVMHKVNLGGFKNNAKPFNSLGPEISGH
jgi:hypothetical protein